MQVPPRLEEVWKYINTQESLVDLWKGEDFLEEIYFDKSWFIFSKSFCMFPGRDFPSGNSQRHSEEPFSAALGAGQGLEGSRAVVRNLSYSACFQSVSLVSSSLLPFPLLPVSFIFRGGGLTR